jgi:hypothetical protein
VSPIHYSKLTPEFPFDALAARLKSKKTALKSTPHHHNAERRMHKGKSELLKKASIILLDSGAKAL